jgi:hypothetical protein
LGVELLAVRVLNRLFWTWEEVKAGAKLVGTKDVQVVKWERKAAKSSDGGRKRYAKKGIASRRLSGLIS